MYIFPECSFGQDSYRGNPWAPWTQNLYAYAGNNPVNYIDPTGHDFEHACLNSGDPNSAACQRSIASPARYASPETDSQVIDHGQFSSPIVLPDKCGVAVSVQSESKQSDGSYSMGNELVGASGQCFLLVKAPSSLTVNSPGRSGSGVLGPGFVVSFAPGGGNTPPYNDKARAKVKDVLTNAVDWLGQKYREIANGVFRSLDNRRQFRITAGDLNAPEPHANFEVLSPHPDRRGRYVVDTNHHVYFDDK